MTARDISAEEWISVRMNRACKMTGHQCFEKSPRPGVRTYYIWRWGIQPTGAVLRALSAGCPLKAAEKFLALFEPNARCKGGHLDPFSEPRRINKKLESA